MPLTIAHPAAVLLFPRRLWRYGDVTAFIVGSMTPDLPYFLPSALAHPGVHNLSALVWFCVPAGILIYGVYRFFLKAPLRDLLPDAVFLRLGATEDQTRFREFFHWIVLGCSLFVGALTHVFWDAFTHQEGQAVIAWPLLQVRLFTVGGYPVFVYKLLQHLSTAVGVMIGMWWIWNRLRRTVPGRADVRRLTFAQRVWVIVATLSIPAVIGVYEGTQALSAHEGMRAVQAFMGRAIFSALPEFALVIVGYSFLWRLKFLPKIW